MIVAVMKIADFGITIMETLIESTIVDATEHRVYNTSKGGLLC